MGTETDLSAIEKQQKKQNRYERRQQNQKERKKQERIFELKIVAVGVGIAAVAGAGVAILNSMLEELDAKKLQEPITLSEHAIDASVVGDERIIVLPQEHESELGQIACGGVEHYERFRDLELDGNRYIITCQNYGATTADTVIASNNQ